ncbi:hypothetical protein BT96DRAFT_929085 [Gymnopus androsaceus JB14]|uniref:Uncharacterized protein n=1 Tax=Gymnopus androsaceus JB14 TaxID=1447944 RepID=A0A6A4GGX1_9AGAR|nr:hypothetical protein BT96DRAFT_929085 [Gymnopus androsaceus JB14]
MSGLHIALMKEPLQPSIQSITLSGCQSRVPFPSSLLLVLSGWSSALSPRVGTRAKPPAKPQLYVCMGTYNLYDSHTSTLH